MLLKKSIKKTFHYPALLTGILVSMLYLFFFSGCQRTKISGYDASFTYKPDSITDSSFFKRIAVNEYFYPFKKTNEDYEKAGKKLKNPLPQTIENINKGKVIYLEYCKQCHGMTGRSDAPMIIKNKFPPPPNYVKRISTITQGKMFHSLTWGKNLMPSFSDELTPDQRWMVIFYVRKLACINDTIN